MGRRPRTAEGQAVFNRIEAARTARGMTRAELADAVGVHYQTIGYLERGEYSPSLALALHIAAALDAPMAALFSLQPLDGDDPSINPPTTRKVIRR
jgi:DNA-binding XRE family transcriptional regulator